MTMIMMLLLPAEDGFSSTALKISKMILIFKIILIIKMIMVILVIMIIMILEIIMINMMKSLTMIMMLFLPANEDFSSTEVLCVLPV